MTKGRQMTLLYPTYQPGYPSIRLASGKTLDVHTCGHSNDNANDRQGVFEMLKAMFKRFSDEPLGFFCRQSKYSYCA